jgi:hypothetical protein
MDLKRLLAFAAAATLAWVGWSQLADDTTVRALAEQEACEGRVCTTALKNRRRTLFGWRFEFTTQGEAARSVTIGCTRAAWVLGDYHCDVEESDTAVDERFQR